MTAALPARLIQKASATLRPFRGGLVANSILLSALLVLATALAVGAAITATLARQVEQNTDRRLAEGAKFFRAAIDNELDDLTAVGTWLTRDQDFLQAVQRGQSQAAQERLAIALRLHAVHEALVADAHGQIMARLRADRLVSPGGDISSEPTFTLALAGRAVHGIAAAGGDGLEEQAAFPIRPIGGERPIAVLRLAQVLDEQTLQQFRQRTGLDSSLFLGQTGIATTLRYAEAGVPEHLQASAELEQQVLGEGRQAFAWADRSGEHERSLFVPLEGPDGRRVAMFALSVPVTTLTQQIRAALLPALSVTLLVTLAGTALAYVVTRRVRTPLSRLAAAAARLQAGDLSTPIPAVRERELKPLAEELERARRSVQQHLAAVASEHCRQQALISALRTPILITTDQGQITEINAAAAALFGPASHLVGRQIQQVLPFAPPPGERIGEESVWQGAVVDATGRSLDVEVSVAPLAEGQLPAARVYAIHDVSRHAELNRLREQLLYSVAHELRGPMSILQNALEILSTEYAELSTEEFAKLVTSARRTTRRLQNLMEDLLSAGSIQSGRFAVYPQPTDIASLFEDALESVDHLLGMRNQQVQLDLPSARVSVLADQRYARQVLTNLLSNASKYSPENAVIRFRAEQEDGFVRVVVEDRGPGIPPEQRAGLFERFYRVRPGNREPGIGLGLAIAKGIVEAHGGRIGVETEVGTGTSVWFTLPAVGGPA